MSIPINVGDVLVTTEILRLRLGQVNRNRLEQDILFDCPVGFVEAAKDVLFAYPRLTTLNEVLKDRVLYGANGEVYDLSTEVETSRRGFEMQWYVQDIKDETYSLIAIGAGRTARIKDWEDILKIYKTVPMGEDAPTLEEYVSVQGVDSSFFEKKAVFRLDEGGNYIPIEI